MTDAKSAHQEVAANDTNVRRQLQDEIRRCEEILADQAWHPDIRHHADLRRSMAVPALREIEQLRAALVQAVSVIQTWHNMEVPEKQRSSLWDIYWRNAPELKPIREALRGDTP